MDYRKNSRVAHHHSGLMIPSRAIEGWMVRGVQAAGEAAVVVDMVGEGLAEEAEEEGVVVGEVVGDVSSIGVQVCQLRLYYPKGLAYYSNRYAWSSA